MQNKIVIPAGYMGSGSSAVTNIISEISGFDINHGSFEYILLHCPDGLFDLEDKLLRGNNALRSDEAIHRFLQCMKKLYKRGYWFSNYKTYLSAEFLRFCEEFVEALDPVRMDGVYWYFQENIDTLPNRLECYVRYVLSLILHNRMPFGKPVKPLNYHGLIMAHPDPEQFYAAARAFLEKIYHALGYEQHHLILDQLLLPHSLSRINNYFDDNARIFVVERDPRDVFILNKYFWYQSSSTIPVPYPLEVSEFCRYYDRIRRNETPTEDSRILRLRFEDLIYRYEESLEKIYPFLGVTPEDHTAKGTIFRPEVSCNNTQLFRKDSQYLPETKIIEKELSPYIYDFPLTTVSAWAKKQVF